MRDASLHMSHRHPLLYALLVPCVVMVFPFVHKRWMTRHAGGTARGPLPGPPGRGAGVRCDGGSCRPRGSAHRQRATMRRDRPFRGAVSTVLTTPSSNRRMRSPAPKRCDRDTTPTESSGRDNVRPFRSRPEQSNLRGVAPPSDRAVNRDRPPRRWPEEGRIARGRRGPDGAGCAWRRGPSRPGAANTRLRPLRAPAARRAAGRWRRRSGVGARVWAPAPHGADSPHGPPGTGTGAPSGPTIVLNPAPQEGEEPVLNVSIGGRFTLWAIEAGTAQQRINRLEISHRLLTRLRIQSVIGTDRPGQVPGVHKQVAHRKGESIPGFHLSKWKLDQLVENAPGAPRAASAPSLTVFHTTTRSSPVASIAPVAPSALGTIR